ncbi:hypothetical protein BISA_1640 [Bifidobacterium saguini DSM 23967]|uniref:Uncharacterized protein n=2 Tax=Bifidobacterium saguini TaxID=762210 RepID=A0A087DE68_9BIFI|nr:hypothetical protein BISA_1640 [Bifidobacterium saguini DSM 23967]
MDSENTGGSALIRVPLEERFRRLVGCRHTSPDYAASVIRDVARMTLREYCAAAVALGIEVHEPQQKEETNFEDSDSPENNFSDLDLDDIDFEDLAFKDFDPDEFENNERQELFYAELKNAIEAIDTAGQEVKISLDMSVASLARLLRTRLLRLDADNLWYTPDHSESARKITDALECFVRPLEVDPKASGERREHRRKSKERQRWVEFTKPLESKSGKARRIPRIPLDQRLKESQNKASCNNGSCADNLLDTLRRLPLADYFEGCSLLVGVATVAPMRKMALARSEQLDVPAFPLLGEASYVQAQAAKSYWIEREECVTRPMGDEDADVNLVSIIAPLAKMADFHLA